MDERIVEHRINNFDEGQHVIKTETLKIFEVFKSESERDRLHERKLMKLKTEHYIHVYVKFTVIKSICIYIKVIKPLYSVTFNFHLVV